MLLSAGTLLVLVAQNFARATDFDDDGKIRLYIGGTFPMEAGMGGWAGGQACLPAVQMALEDVNARADILPGYRLHLNFTNSKCQPGLAAKQMFEMLYEPPTKHALLAGCSPVTTMVAETAPVWNLLVMSYGASSPALSNRRRFPTLFRTHPSANMQNPTRIRLFQKFNWKRVSILQSVEEVFTSTAKDLEETCRRQGIAVERLSFYGDPTDAMRTLQRQDARIIVVLSYVTEARRVLCQAYRHGLYGRRHVWFFIGWYADTWFWPVADETLNCTREQMEEAAALHFTTESIMLSVDEQPTRSGMTGAQFVRRLSQHISDPANTGGFPEAPLAYDAIWALALAFNCTASRLPVGVRLEEFTYADKHFTDTLFQCMLNTSFKGVSGDVSFSNLGDRLARTQIEQLQGGRYRVVGYYDTTMKHLDWKGTEMWGSRGGSPPPDATIVRDSLLVVSPLLYYTVALFSILGVAACVFALRMNRRNAHRSIIVHSQPECNNLLIIGCALSCADLFLMGMPTKQLALPPYLFSLLCHCRLSILMVGFSFAYGSMFAKMWIAYRIASIQQRARLESQRDEDAQNGSGANNANNNGLSWDAVRSMLSSVVGRHAFWAEQLVATTTLGGEGPSFGQDSIQKQFSQQLNRVQNGDERLQPIPATRFYSVVALLVLVDLILILTWGVVDPLQRRRQFFPLQEPPPTDGDEAVDEMLRPVLELCESDNQEVWIALVMGYKCLLLIFGLFLAYESRRVKLLYINDVRLVGLAVYNVAVLAIITGPVVTFLIRSQANSNFGFIAATVLLCSVVSLGLVFLPKWWHLRRHATDEAAVAEAVIPKLSLVEQKRLEQLRRENERLVNEIAQRDAQMRWVRSRMEAVQRAENARVFANISTEPSPSQQRGAMALQQMEIPRHRVKDGSSDYCTDTDEEEDENSTGLVELQPSDGTGHFSSGAVVNPEEEDVESDEILL